MLKKHVSSLLWVALCLLFLQVLMPTMAYRITAHEHAGQSVASVSYSSLETTREFRSEAVLQGAENNLRPVAAIIPDLTFSQHVAASRSPSCFFHQVSKHNGYAPVLGSSYVLVTQSRAPPFLAA